MPRPRCVWDLPQRSMRTTRLRGCCCTQVLFKTGKRRQVLHGQSVQ